MYDIFFLSYDELNAEDNFRLLKSRFPQSKRIHGIPGILNAHKECAKKSLTKNFFVVDGDNVITDDFNFNIEESKVNEENVLVWRSINPVNKLVYGYGGIKLLPKRLILNMPNMIVDMTTSLSSNFRIVEVIGSVTKFNTSPFNSWRAAFRECVKLSSKIIDRQKNDQTEERLNIWCTTNYSAEYGEYVILGANQGKSFGFENKNNTEMLKLINDFDWLKKYYEKNVK